MGQLTKRQVIALANIIGAINQQLADERQMKRDGKLPNDAGIHPVPIKFSYAISKNAALIDAELKTLQEIGKPAEEFVAYNTEVFALARSISGVSDERTTRIKLSSEQLADFETARKEIDERFRDVIAAQKIRDAEFERLLDEPAEIALHLVSIEHFPPAGLMPEQMSSLMPIIRED